MGDLGNVDPGFADDQDVKTFAVDHIVHRRNPFEESRAADQVFTKLPAGVRRWYAERDVLAKDGTFPHGEGHLLGPQPSKRDPDWKIGRGRPGKITVAGHRGTKHQQQDAFDGVRFHVDGKPAAALVVADGVSAAGRLAKPASSTAVRVFLAQVEKQLMTPGVSVAAAIRHAAFAANFEVIRQVLFDDEHDGRFDVGDKRRLRERTGANVPTRPLTSIEMQQLARKLTPEVVRRAEEGREALTTFAAAIAIGNDLYTFSSGDAVVSFYRPTEETGRRTIHLTHRDQAVVELLRDGVTDLHEHDDVYENIITDCFGDSPLLSGTLRSYPNLLEPGDRLIVASDGLGLDRVNVEETIERQGDDVAAELVRKQVEQIVPGEYQDNIGVVAMLVE